MKKKIALSLCVAVLLVAILPIAAYAYGSHGGGPHGGGGRATGDIALRYALCPIDGCEVLGPHEHDGIWYHCASYPYGGGGFCGGNGRNR